MNVQDAGAIKNVWRTHPDGQEADVVTYGTEQHENDPNRRLLKINFYEPAMLSIGKGMLDKHLSDDTTEFVRAFRTVDFSEPPEPTDRSALTRWDRRVLAYNALLFKAGYERPASLSTPRGRNLFRRDLTNAMQSSSHEMAAQFASAATVLRDLSSGTGSVSWAGLAGALEHLHFFISKRDTGWQGFNDNYIRNSSTGESWADAEFRAIIHMIAQQNGANKVRRMIDRHTATVNADYADQIIDDLHAGKLVIIDQSLGDDEMNQIVADRIAEKTFQVHQRLFSTSATPPAILMYMKKHIIDCPKVLKLTRLTSGQG